MVLIPMNLIWIIIGGESKKDEDRAKGSEEMQEENDEKHGKGIADQILESVLDRIF